MGENPGPGAYKVNGQDIKEKSSPIAFNMTQGVSFKTALHTVSSSGGIIAAPSSFFRNQSSTSRMINQQSGSTMLQANMPNIVLQNPAGLSMFRDETSREQFNHYIPKASNNNIALNNLGPGSYFKEQSPFLKRSFNTSLPNNRFY